MKFQCSINCECNEKNFFKLYSYNKKPKNEKNFFITGKYNRMFYECATCEHLYAKHNFKINKLYSKQYLDLTYKNEKGLDKRFKYITGLPVSLSDNKGRAKRVDEFFKKTKKLQLLDVGSGLGVFLHEMRKKNWKVNGIEIDTRYSDYCKKKHNLNVYKKNLLKFKTKKKFDLISFNKILEHVDYPQRLLKSAKKILKKNGIIYIEVPDVYAKVGGKFRGEFCFEHFHIFSLSSLGILIRRSGLYPIKLMRIQEPSGKYTIFSFTKKLDKVNFNKKSYMI
jgi:SAM-dependent methyltransferase